MRGAPTMRARRSALRRGFTLVELAIGLTVAGILLALAVPSWQGQVARGRLEGAANELAMDLYAARAEALRRGEPVLLTVNTDGTGYSVGTSSQTLKRITLPSAVTMAPVKTSVTFDGLRGAAGADAALELSSSAWTKAKMATAITTVGRVRLCSSVGAVPGYPACSS